MGKLIAGFDELQATSPTEQAAAQESATFVPAF